MESLEKNKALSEDSFATAMRRRNSRRSAPVARWRCGNAERGVASPEVPERVAAARLSQSNQLIRLNRFS